MSYSFFPILEIFLLANLLPKEQLEYKHQENDPSHPFFMNINLAHLLDNLCLAQLLLRLGDSKGACDLATESKSHF